MLRGIRNNWHKSKAAVLVETAFARSAVPFILPEGKDSFANALVERLWSNDPGVFDGSEGPRPHPITIAAAALAQAVIDHIGKRVVHSTCLAALAAITEEIQANRYAYSLNGADLILIDLAERALADGLGHVSASTEDRATEQSVPTLQHGKEPLDTALNLRKIDLDQRLAAARRE